MLFSVALIKNKDSNDYSAIAPDLACCYSYGDNIESAIEKIEIIIRKALVASLLSSNSISPPRPLEYWQDRPYFKEAEFCQYKVNVDQLKSMVAILNFCQLDATSAKHKDDN